jgi:hypothetical protein
VISRWLLALICCSGFMLMLSQHDRMGAACMAIVAIVT